jgi:hypothetical protein
MKVSTSPFALPNCSHTEPKVRWVRRSEPRPYLAEDVTEEVMVLQQKLMDGWGDEFWADVQIEQP